MAKNALFLHFWIFCGLHPRNLRHKCTFGRRLVSKLNLTQFPRSYGRNLQPMTHFLPKNTLFLKKNAFFCKNIWSCPIFVVPLHSLSDESDVL